MKYSISIPTPEEVDYYENTLFEEIVQKVAKSISNRIFVIKPTADWIRFKNQVNEVLSQSGWKLLNGWQGTKDDGYVVWEVVPK